MPSQTETPRLVVFDVDGTLCDTCDVDEECFLRAVGESLGRDALAVDWSKAPQLTDAGILDWLWRMHRRRSPNAEETAVIVGRFVELLTGACRSAPHRFRAIAGAKSALVTLERRGVQVAAATGGWNAPARLKLEAAQIAPRILLASSSDSADRVRVFQLAAQRAVAAEGARADVVLVGDGIWDVEVARRLEWRFVGVGVGEKADRLRKAGAGTVLPDLSDIEALETAVETAGL